ncbi:MAG: Gfo/Idh/MocA family oxidoreductase [Oscillospiraceae bacterium]|nr:Gfo/Idh/MocA family oxidoreductase [Oscillospiraceae bacterium]
MPGYRNKLRVGIIGCGFITNYTHAGTLEKMDDIDVVAVADPVEKNRNAMAARLGAPNAYADHRALFDAEKGLDAVIIAVPPAAHEGIEEEAIERGIHFMVEKPMTLDMGRGWRVAKGAANAGLVAAASFQDRYMDITDRMKEEIARTDIGQIHATWAQNVAAAGWWRSKATSGGQLFEQTIHLVDMVRYLFGEYETVFAMKTSGIIKESDFADFDIDDSSTAVFRMKSGATATFFSACYLLSGGVSIENGMVALGRQRSLAYSLRKHLRVVTRGADLLYRQLNDSTFDSNAAFFKAIRSGDLGAVRSTYGDGLKSLEACFAANKSMDSGAPVKI